MPSSTPHEEAPWKAGLRGAKANLGPGIALQVLAAVLVVAYYNVPSARDGLSGLGTLRDRWGFWFPVMTTGLFGGVLPYLFLRLTPSTRERYTLGQALGLTAFWAYKGFEIDLWYHFMAGAIGAGQTPTIVVAKMALDQFVYCPLWAIPTTAVIYSAIESHYRLGEVWSDLKAPNWYRRKVMPILISNIGIWVPTVCAIYALPTPLQLPLQNVVLCFFTLIVAHVTAKKRS